MKLKLTRFRKSTQKTMLIFSKGKGYKWGAIGDVIDVAEDVGYDILSNFGDVVEKVEAAPVAETKSADEEDSKPRRSGRPKADKMASAPENKTALI